MSKRITILIYFLLAINVLYVLSGVIHIPLQSVDVVGIWLFKAKAFFVEGGLPLQTLKNPDFILFHPQYPLLLPFLYSLIYFGLGRVWELPILLLYPIYYVLILFLSFKVFKKMKLSTAASLIYVYIYSMLSPLLGQAGRLHAGSADIVLVLLSWIAVYFWQRSQLTKKRTLINQSAWIITCLVMVASQIKLEGLFIGSLIFSLPLSKQHKLLLLGLASMPTLLWSYLVKVLALPTDFALVIPSAWELIDRSRLIMSWTIREMLNYKNWYIFWPLFWLGLTVTKWPKSHPEILGLAQAAFLAAGAFALVYLILTIDAQAEVGSTVSAHLGSSIDRVLFQLTPFIYPIFVFKSQQIWLKIKGLFQG